MDASNSQRRAGWPRNKRRQIQEGTGNRLLETLPDCQFIWLGHSLRELANDLAPDVVPDLDWLPPNPTGVNVLDAWRQIQESSKIDYSMLEKGMREGHPKVDDVRSTDKFGRIKRYFSAGPARTTFVAVLEPSLDDPKVIKVITVWVDSKPLPE